MKKTVRKIIAFAALCTASTFGFAEIHPAHAQKAQKIGSASATIVSFVKTSGGETENNSDANEQDNANQNEIHRSKTVVIRACSSETHKKDEKKCKIFVTETH